MPVASQSGGFLSMDGESPLVSLIVPSALIAPSADSHPPPLAVDQAAAESTIDRGLLSDGGWRLAVPAASLSKR